MTRRTTPRETWPPSAAADTGCARVATPASGQVSAGQQLYLDGLRALEAHDRDTALRLFRDAWKYEKELDPATRQQLQDKLILLQPQAPAPAPEAETATLALEAVNAQQQMLRDKMFREITSETAEAQRMSATDPKAALDRLVRMRDRVNESEVDPTSKKQLLTVVDRSVQSLEQYIESNRAEIDLAERNRDVVQGVQLDAQREQEVQNKLASLVEEFNQLLDDQRYPEAERIAKQAHELAPDAEVVQNLLWQARFVRRMQEQMADQGQVGTRCLRCADARRRSSAPVR